MVCFGAHDGLPVVESNRFQKRPCMHVPDDDSEPKIVSTAGGGMEPFQAAAPCVGTCWYAGLFFFEFSPPTALADATSAPSSRVGERIQVHVRDFGRKVEGLAGAPMFVAIHATAHQLPSANGQYIDVQLRDASDSTLGFVEISRGLLRCAAAPLHLTFSSKSPYTKLT